MSPELIKNYTLRISQANRSEIIVIVYDLADQYISDGVSCFDNKDIEGYVDACHSAKKCIDHLINALDDTYELAYPLLRLYAYFNKEISMAAARYDEERLLKVREQLASLGEAFKETAKADASSPMMQNSQTVIAGLTYGRGDINESLYDEGSRRGYTV